MRFYNTLIFIFCTVILSAQYIAPNINDQFQSTNEVTYLLILESKASIEGHQNIRGKEAKSNFVYHTLKEHAENTQYEIIQFLNKKNIKHQSFFVTNMIKITSDFEVFNQLKSRPEIEKILWDIPTKMSWYQEERLDRSHRDATPEWGILKMQADKVWELGYTGENVVVGGQDTGYDWLVSPLQKKYRGYVSDSMGIHDYNWHDAIREPSPLHSDSINPCGFDVKIPCDDNNHGTHTMGTMVGSDTSNAIGVAPDSKWIACRNMDRGYGSPSTYTECFEWFLAPTDINGQNPDPTKAPHVINNSWGCPEMEGCNPSNWSFMEDVVNNLRAAGVVVVVSAGNDGGSCNTVANPAAIFDGSFTVGATRSKDSIAGFSSRGIVLSDGSLRIKPNISAPGQNVRSVVRGGDFRNFSGTSMAGPHVAGLVSLIISANPNLAGEVELIEDIIEQSAVPLITEQTCDGLTMENIPNATYGHGRINALRAIELAQSYNQEFAPTGATWTYDLVHMEGEPSILKIEYSGDTVIQNKPCKVLTRNELTCDYMPNKAYIHQDYKRVFFYSEKRDSFYLLYDFAKGEGESYRVGYFDWNNNNPNTGINNLYYTVDSVATVELDGEEFIAQFIHETTDLSPRQRIIIPRIGNLQSLFEEDERLCDDILTTQLRCYSDNEISIHITADEHCIPPSNISTTNINDIRFFPNPVNHSFQLVGLTSVASFKVISAEGKVVSSGSIKGGQSIFVEQIPNGMYFMILNNGERIFKFVKTNQN